jgi:hypothetical protein
MQNDRPTIIVEEHSSKKLWIPIIILSFLVVISLVFTMVKINQLNKSQATLADTQSQLSITNNDLVDSSNELLGVKDQLKSVQDQLAKSNGQLSATQTLLKTTQGQLTSTQGQLTSEQGQLNLVQTQLTTTQDDVKTKQIQISGLQNDLTDAKSQVDIIKTNLDRMSSSYGYVYNDPTYDSMKTFLTSDLTDQHAYVDGTYVCWNYAADVILNAAKQHIRCAFVYIEFIDSAHADIAFNTTDKGMVYIDPQTDDIVQLKVGVHYYQSDIPAPGYYNVPPSYDDTVEIFKVIW